MEISNSSGYVLASAAQGSSAAITIEELTECPISDNMASSQGSHFTVKEVWLWAHYREVNWLGHIAQHQKQPV